MQHIIEMFLNNIVIFIWWGLLSSLRTQEQQKGLIFSLVDRLLDSEQELHHRYEGRSFASQLFAPHFLVVTEGINTLEFLVVIIITMKPMMMTILKKSRMICKHRWYID